MIVDEETPTTDEVTTGELCAMPKKARQPKGTPEGADKDKEFD